MSTFAQLLAAENSGHVWLLDVSFDDFATVSYRYSTVSVTTGGVDYDGRIADMSPVQRSFGRDHLPAATTVNLSLENSDFAVDWLADRSTVASQVLKARFKLTLLLYSKADPTDTATQILGYFSSLDQPELDNDIVRLQLADDSLGRLAEPLTTPTIREWLAAEADAPNGGMSETAYTLGSPIPATDWDVPLPLVFGLGEHGAQVPAYLAIRGYEAYPGPVNTRRDPATSDPNVASTHGVPIVVCVAKAGTAGVAGAGATNEITKLQATYAAQLDGVTSTVAGVRIWGATIDIPSEFTSHSATPSNGVYPRVKVWQAMRSAAFTKDGRSWQVVYIDFNVDHYAQWFTERFNFARAPTTGGGASQVDLVPISVGGVPNDRRAVMFAFTSFRCNGSPLSVVSHMPAPGAEETDTIPSLRLVDHIFDAIAYYSKASPTNMDPTAWQRASKARGGVFGAGIIQPARPRPKEDEGRYGWVSPNPRDGIVGILRTALGEMCGSCDADLFMTREGLYSITTNVFDYTAYQTAVGGTATTITEPRTSKPRIRTPSPGERWAPYNRVMLVGPGGAPFGPYDNQDGIDEWGKVLPITLQAKWLALLQWGGFTPTADGIWYTRSLESKVRPALRWLVDREYLSLELADYFFFTWTRGGLSTHALSGHLFRVEGQTIDPATLAVELEGIWVNDLVTDRPYLLDDEEFTVRVRSTAGRNANVEDGNTQIGFDSGDLVADGVVAGDILRLLDTTQADDVFTRYRELRIASVNSATDVFVAGSDLDFSSPPGVPTPVANWEIRRGFTTYPTSGTDPTNYPSGATMYGKACDTSNTYSDASAANKLLEG